MDSMEDIDPSKIVVIDESGSNLGMTSTHARAEGGERAKAPKPHSPGERYSLVGAITLTCVLAVMYIDCAIDGDIFKAFIEQLLLKHLCPGMYVVFDNVKFHKQESVISLIESTGAKVVLLPPYSPELSPIEKMGSKIKEILKRHKPRTRAQFHDALALAVDSVNEYDLEGWYDDCGYQVAA